MGSNRNYTMCSMKTFFSVAMACVDEYIDLTFGNRRPGPLFEFIISTSIIFLDESPTFPSTLPYLKGIHLSNDPIG